MTETPVSSPAGETVTVPREPLESMLKAMDEGMFYADYDNSTEWCAVLHQALAAAPALSAPVPSSDVPARMREALDRSAMELASTMRSSEDEGWLWWASYCAGYPEAMAMATAYHDAGAPIAPEGDPAPAVGVTVKPLSWRRGGDAAGLGFWYVISIHRDGYVADEMNSRTRLGLHGTEQAARAACQAHFDGKLLSWLPTLVPATHHDQGEPVADAARDKAIHDIAEAIELGQRACDDDSGSANLGVFRQAFFALDAVEQMLLAATRSSQADAGDFEEVLRLAEIGEYLYSACAYSYGDGYTEPRECGIEWQWQQSKPDEYGQGMLLAASTAWHDEQAADGIVTEAAKLRSRLSPPVDQGTGMTETGEDGQGSVTQEEAGRG